MINYDQISVSWFMNTQEYLSKELGLPQIQIEAINKLAKVCGMKSLFEGFLDDDDMDDVDGSKMVVDKSLVSAYTASKELEDQKKADEEARQEAERELMLKKEHERERLQSEREEPARLDQLMPDTEDHPGNKDYAFGITSDSEGDNESSLSDWTVDDISAFDATKNTGDADVNHPTEAESAVSDQQLDLMKLIKVLGTMSRMSNDAIKELMVTSSAAIDNTDESTKVNDISTQDNSDMIDSGAVNDTEEARNALSSAVDSALKNAAFKNSKNDVTNKIKSFVTKYPNNPFNDIFSNAISSTSTADSYMNSNKNIDTILGVPAGTGMSSKELMSRPADLSKARWAAQRRKSMANA